MLLVRNSLHGSAISLAAGFSGGVLVNHFLIAPIAVTARVCVLITISIIHPRPNGEVPRCCILGVILQRIRLIDSVHRQRTRQPVLSGTSRAVFASEAS